MSPNTRLSRPIALFAAAAAVAAALALTSASDATASADVPAIIDPHLQVYADVDRPELHCNGDSTRITVHVLNPDGTPAAGKDVRIFADASIKTAHGTVASGDVAGQSNARGILHARVTPKTGTTVRWLLRVTADGVGAPSPGAWYACDFSSDTAFTIAGDVFNDANANGVHDRHERPAHHAKLTIATGYSFGSFVPPHTTRTDHRGQFGWTGLFQDRAIPVLDDWHVCLTPEPNGTQKMIVSLNGALISPNPCISLLLQPGVNYLSLGIK